MNRRRFLQTTAAGLGVLGLPCGLALAAAKASGRKLITVFVQGGWDPTRVFATEFDNADVDMELDAALSTAGNIGFVDHETRPSVGSFFQSNHSRMLVANGVMVRSIAHEICTMIAMTGDTSGLLPDWPAIAAANATDDYTLPHLVVGGPSFSGELGAAVARAGQAGQLEGLLSGEILSGSDMPVLPMTRASQGIVDRYMERRIDARARAALPGSDTALTQALLASNQRAMGLKDYRYIMDFTSSLDLRQQATVGVDALQTGLARCVTLGHSGGWDTHANNDEDQSPLWEDLFQGLATLMALLDDAPGSQGGSLSDETLVLVLSEMGRTPQLNATMGKDHWPFTSMLLIGAGFTSNRVIGGFDSGYMGRNVSPSDGQLSDDGQILSAEAMGATVLQILGIDPAEYVSGADPIEGIIL
jgi:uncharacterized protein (DUF1501 family)